MNERNGGEHENYIEEKRMWLIHGAAVGTVPLSEVGPMTDLEKKFFYGVKADRGANEKAGLRYACEMPGEWGCSF